MGRLTGNQAQFTYDFGIAIAQSTVNKLVRLTGATVSLASAFYALQVTGEKYVNTLRENSLRFGGVLSTLKAMEQAQDRLIKGQSLFTVDDQLAGMNRLMAAGVDVKRNFDFISKAAHATGKSIGEFSNAIYQGISGNMGALVDMGMLTQRAVRYFEKYPANTIMRQQAIMSFMKQHKGLLSLIKNDFGNVHDQMLRIKETWNSFLQSIVGKPNDPNSLYGQSRNALKYIADAFARNYKEIRKYGFVIGKLLGWIVTQVGHFVVWLGKQVKKTLQSVWKVTDDYQNQTRTMLVWLEFWKLKVVDFFKEYGSEIKTVLKLLLLFKAMKLVFVIGSAAIASLIKYKIAMQGINAMWITYTGRVSRGMGRISSLAVFLPMWMRSGFVKTIGYAKAFGSKLFAIFGSLGKFLKNALKGLFSFKWLNPRVMLSGLKNAGTFLVNIFRNLPSIIQASGNSLLNITKSLAGKGGLVGLIIAAVAALGVLYAKSERFRRSINSFLKMVWSGVKLVWNFIMWNYVQIRAGINSLGRLIKGTWNKFMDSRVGRWIKTIGKALKDAFGWLWDLMGKIWDKLKWVFDTASSWLAKSGKETAEKEGISTAFIENKPDGTTPITAKLTTPTTQSPLDSTKNPMTSAENSLPDDYESVDMGNSVSQNFNKGAIQIIVQKGENIDENRLARKIYTIIKDMERTGKVRGGA